KAKAAEDEKKKQAEAAAKKTADEQAKAKAAEDEKKKQAEAAAAAKAKAAEEEKAKKDAAKKTADDAAAAKAKAAEEEKEKKDEEKKKVASRKTSKTSIAEDEQSADFTLTQQKMEEPESSDLSEALTIKEVKKPEEEDKPKKKKVVKKKESRTASEVETSMAEEMEKKRVETEENAVESTSGFAEMTSSDPEQERKRKLEEAEMPKPSIALTEDLDAKLSVAEHPKNVHITERGQTLVLHCAFNRSIGVARWIRNGRDLRNTIEKIEMSVEKNVAKLVILDMTANDEGSYSCQYDDVRSEAATVKVEIVPSIRFESIVGHPIEKEIRVQAGKSFDCKVISSGAPTPIVSVTLNGEPVRMRGEITDYGDFLSVRIRNTTSADSGELKATATNSTGKHSLSITLIVKDVPAAPKRPTAGEVEKRAVTIEWKPPSGDQEVTEYVIERKSTEYSRWRSVGTVPASRLYFRATGLLNNEIYAFRIVAVNDLGQGKPSPSVDVETPYEWPEGEEEVSANTFSMKKSESLAGRADSSEISVGDDTTISESVALDEDLKKAVEEDKESTPKKKRVVNKKKSDVDESKKPSLDEAEVKAKTDDEAVATKKNDEEAERKKKEDEKRRLAEEAKEKEEESKRAEEEAKKKKKSDDAEAKKKAEEQKAKAEAEEKADEAAAKKKTEEEKAKAEAEAKKKEEEAKRKAEEEEQAKKKKDSEAADKKKSLAEEKARKKKV
ncbi:hypothetical protein PMAYCL1PPCAC_28828, partial [Pristionchus mayeri]